MNITEIRHEPRSVTIAIECDICGKRSLDPSPKGWHHFSHSHNSWGNDSIESYKYFDVCSVDCYTKQLEKSIDAMSDEIRPEISGMNYEFAISLYKKLTPR